MPCGLATTPLPGAASEVLKRHRVPNANWPDLVWADTAYDANNNVVRQVAPHYGVQDTSMGDTTSATYDVVDRPTLVTGPDTSADPAGERTRYQYDVAGRLTQVTLPLGVRNGTLNNIRTLNYAYDGWDRVTAQTLNHDTEFASSEYVNDEHVNDAELLDSVPRQRQRGDVPQVVEFRAVQPPEVYCRLSHRKPKGLQRRTH